MTEKEVLAWLGKTIEDFTERPADEVTLDKSFDELEVDSLTRVEIITAAQDEFHIKVSDDDVDNLATVRDVVTFIVDQTGGSA